MSKPIVPLLFDGFKIKIQMTDGEELTLYREDMPYEIASEVENLCREKFEEHYEEIIIKHKEG